MNKDRSTPAGQAYQAEFYTTPAGNKPVLRWLLSLSEADQDKVQAAIAKLEAECPNTQLATKMPGTGGLYEVNKAPKLSHGRSFRLFYCVHQNRVLLLDGYIKKSAKTDPTILDRARQRMKDCLSGL